MKKLIVLLLGMAVVLVVGVARLNDLQGQRHALEKTVEQIEAEITSYEKVKNNKKAEIDNIEREIEEVQRRGEALSAALAEAEAEVVRYEGLLYMFSADGEKLESGFTPYRDMLEVSESELYDVLRATVLRREFELDVERFGMDLDSIAEVYFSVLKDDPSIFWMEGQVVGYRYGNSDKVHTIELSALVHVDEIEGRMAKLEQEASALVSGVKHLSGDLEKIKAVHDYLVETVDYVDGQDVYSSYSAIVQKQAVCEGYAKAFGYFMDRLGIPNALCTGYAGENHAWNLVMVDGTYYNVDVTWDDPVGAPAGSKRYDYFLLSDAVMATTHTRDALSGALPACTSQRYDEATWDEQEAARLGNAA